MARRSAASFGFESGDAAVLKDTTNPREERALNEESFVAGLGARPSGEDGARQVQQNFEPIFHSTIMETLDLKVTKGQIASRQSP